MSAVVDFDFEVPQSCEAHEPPEARGLARDEVRLMVATRSNGKLDHARFNELPRFLRAGRPRGRQHVRTDSRGCSLRRGRTARRSSCGSRRRCRTGRWLVELRLGAERFSGGAAGERLALPGGAHAELARPLRRQPPAVGDARSSCRGARPLPRRARPADPLRLRVAPVAARRRTRTSTPSSPAASSRRAPAGPSRASCSRGWSRRASWSRRSCCTPASRRSERDERPIPSGTACRRATARAGQRRPRLGRPRDRGRARRSCARSRRLPRPTAAVASGEGWTALVITPERGLRAIDGLITGWHEPRASHLSCSRRSPGERAARAVVPGGARALLPLARVRRQPADPAVGARPSAGLRGVSLGRDGRGRRSSRTRRAHSPGRIARGPRSPGCSRSP